MLTNFIIACAFLTFNKFRFADRARDRHQPVEMSVEKRLEDLGIKLPPAPKAAANYSPVLRQGDLLYLSGHLPMKEDGSLITGRLGEGKDVEFGYNAARQVGLNLLSSLQEELGSLDNVEQVVKLFGIVQSTNDFHDQHRVVNGTFRYIFSASIPFAEIFPGCSDLMKEVFGEKVGLHARSAIGTNSLPLNLAVEIEAIVKVKPMED